MAESHSDPIPPAASVVIPAYDEGRVIGRCLEALRGPHTRAPLEVVVAANGCSDDTADVARSFNGVTVLDLPAVGKSGALNAGDAAASTFPRIYLDADVTVTPEALEALVAALDTDAALVAAPRVRFRTDGSSRAVRAYYDVYRELPYVRSGLVGLGIYGLSRAGRARFEQFPAVQADDLFVQRLFSPQERVIVDGWFDVQVPRDLRNLIAVRTRVAKGNAALADAGEAQLGGATGDFSASTGSTVRSLATLLVRRPGLLPGALVYVAVVLAARRAARGAPSTTSTGPWHRDESTR